ncbi:hypothetical protein GWG65_30365 [Bradyrhizobium sp. CSA207]|uniref:hypothetical protein n=1 Tax=Bradyrhizobium sp. CSA207 TaxID=2698826 RepID=UPI0023AF2521|nr:hypothetical protein [Bradyrhizobium sp. CSA207]MDE5445637.1 hypothetical protein [Bradyrhizobium sp. CSA207]
MQAGEHYNDISASLLRAMSCSLIPVALDRPAWPCRRLVCAARQSLEPVHRDFPQHRSLALPLLILLHGIGKIAKITVVI